MFDYLIIGAGISGAAAAYELSTHGNVALVDAESRAGYHSTGRSAAMYTPNYGGELIRKICRLSHAFLDSPPADFCSQPILRHRGMMTVASPGQEQAMALKLAEGGSEYVALDVDQTVVMAPFLRRQNVLGAIYEAAVASIDVDALHQGFLGGMRKRGGTLLLEHGVTGLHRRTDGWVAILEDGQIQAKVVINAAGAWADEIGRMAGAVSIGLVPKRRTAILVDPPEGVDLASVPAIDFMGINSYIIPNAGQLMVSPGDESPVEPQDIQTDDMEVAVLVDWLENQTSIEVRHLNHEWAGLRSFVSDGAPVVGFDPVADDFFWLAGQGGYGIMMSSSQARATVSLITERQLPGDFINSGIGEWEISPARIGEHEAD
ncbi:MAG: FAD-binding oxidoreductase [Granulosicoccus sp.]|nr:FAD-binding oxidoreductase [Granulosicoccus sp.]